MEKLRPSQQTASGDSGAWVVLCTCSNEAEAEFLANELVQDRLAACVNVLAGIRSIYRWQNEIQDERECLLIIKTSRESFGALEAQLEKLHSYDVPEILALPVAQGLPAYLEWLLGETDQEQEHE